MKTCYPEVLTVPAKIDCDDFSTFCYIGIDLDLSKPKGMPLNLKLHTYSFTTKYINMAKA